MTYVVFFLYMRFVFFFSSRRRHTRFKCDWSSDVCSSDLYPVRRDLAHDVLRRTERRWQAEALRQVDQDIEVGPRVTRSEERRVGKERRSRSSSAPSTRKPTRPVASYRTWTEAHHRTWTAG